MGAAVRIAIIDVQDIYRDGIASVVSMRPELVLVASARDGTTSIDAIADAGPDVVLLNTEATAGSFASVCGDILERSSANVIALSNDPSQEEINIVIGAGAIGYVAKKSSYETVLEAIRAVSDGQTYIDPSVAVAMLLQPKVKDDVSDAIGGLTDEEFNVLRLLVDAQTNSEIAEELGLPATTVQYCVRQICLKLDVRNRTEAAVLAQGWLQRRSKDQNSRGWDRDSS